MQLSWVVTAKVYSKKVDSKIIAEVLAHFQVALELSEKVKMASTHLVKYHYVSIKKEKSESMLSLTQI